MKRILFIFVFFLLSLSNAGAADFGNVIWKTVTAERVNDLIKAGAKVNARNNNGDTPLFLAAQNNSDPAVVEALIKAGANVNARDKHGWTPLKWAAQKNSNPVVVEMLIKAGANELESSLDHAKHHNKNPAVIEAFVKTAARQGSLLNADWKTVTVKEIDSRIKAGADVNARDRDGNTSLMLAVMNNSNPAVVKRLIRAQAGTDEGMVNINLRNDIGYTPLMLAAKKNSDPAVIEMLIKAGAYINARDRNGNTPLMWAVINNSNPLRIWKLIQCVPEVRAVRMLTK